MNESNAEDLMYLIDFMKAILKLVMKYPVVYMDSIIELIGKTDLDKDLTELSIEPFMEYPEGYITILSEISVLFHEDLMLVTKIMDERLNILPEFLDKYFLEKIAVEYAKDLTKLCFEMVREYSKEIVNMFKPTLCNEEFCSLSVHFRDVLHNRMQKILHRGL